MRAPIFARLGLWLGLCLACRGGSVLPAELSPGRYPGEIVYAVWMYVGTPPIPLRLEVTFLHGEIVLYRDQRVSSASCGTDAVETDVVYVGARRFRVPVRSDPRRLAFDSRCPACDGALGLGKGSTMWQLWPHASFSVASTSFGEMHPLIARGRDCSSFSLRCDGSPDEPSLCTTSCEVLDYEATDDARRRPLRLAPDSAETLLPQALFDRYTLGRNAFDGVGGGDAGPLRIRADAEIGAACPATARDVPLRWGEFVGRFATERQTDVSLASNAAADDDSVTLGGWVWERFVFYRGHGGLAVVMKRHAVRKNLSRAGAYLFLAIMWYLIRWKRANVTDPTAPSDVARPARYLDDFYLVTAPVLVLAALLLPFAREVLADFPVLYGLSAGIAVASVVAEALASAVVRARPSSPYELFLAHYLRNLAHETLLSIGLWVSVLERRTEGVTSFLTVVANVYTLYNVWTYAFLLIVFFSYAGVRGFVAGRDGRPWLPPLAGIATVFLLGFQAFASYVYFVAPVLKINAQLYEDVILPFLAIFYVVLSTLAVYVVSLGIQKRVLRAARKPRTPKKRPVQAPLLRS